MCPRLTKLLLLPDDQMIVHQRSVKHATNAAVDLVCLFMTKGPHVTLYQDANAVANALTGCKGCWGQDTGIYLRLLVYKAQSVLLGGQDCIPILYQPCTS